MVCCVFPETTSRGKAATGNKAAKPFLIFNSNLGGAREEKTSLLKNENMRKSRFGWGNFVSE